jgi:MFS family permease
MMEEDPLFDCSKRSYYTIEETVIDPEPELDDDDDDDDDNDERQHLKAEFAGLPNSIQPSPLFAITTLFLLIVGQALSITSGLDAIIALICRHHFPDKSREHTIDPLRPDPRCRQSDVAALVASFSSYRGIISGIIGIIVSPKLCALSDRVGRRPVLIFSGAVTALADLIVVLCSLYPAALDYNWMLVSSVLAGAGGTTLCAGVFSSYFADCIKPNVRARYFSWIDASVASGVALGPGLGSFILQKFNTLSLILGITVVCDVIFCVLVYFFVPESRTVRARRQSQTSYDEARKERLSQSMRQQYVAMMNVFGPLRQLAFPHVRRGKDRINAWLLVAILSLSTGLGVGISLLLVMYPETKFGWSSVETGYLLSMVGAVKSFSLAVTFPGLFYLLGHFLDKDTHRLDKVDAWVIRIGLTGAMCGFIILSKSETGIEYVEGVLTEVFFGIAGPAVKNGIIKYSSKDDIGEVFGALGMLIHIATVFCPFVFLTVFNLTLKSRPQMVFEIGACTLAVLVFLSMMLSRRSDEEHLLEEGVVDNANDRID